MGTNQPWDEDGRRDEVASEFFAPSYQSASPYEQVAVRYIVELEHRLWHLDVDMRDEWAAHTASQSDDS